MKKIIGVIILSCVFIVVIMASGIAYGWQTTLEGIVISFVLAGFIMLGAYLVVD